MHLHFADWYREASIDASGERLDSRWQGIESASRQGDFGKERIADLLSWAYCQDPSPGSPGWLRPYFQGHDSAFPMRGNDQEMAVLAASLLINQLDDSTASPLFALGAVNAALILGDSVIPDLTIVAAAWLSRQADSQRSIPAPPKRVHLDDLTTIKSQIDALGQMPETTQLLHVAKQLQKILSSTISTLGSMRTAQNALVRYCKAIGEARGEEVDLYWWVLQQEPSNRRRADRGVTRALRLAQELTNLTVFDVEHPSAGPLLAHALPDRGQAVPLNQVVGVAEQASAESQPPFHCTPLLHLLRGRDVPKGLEPRATTGLSKTLSAAELALAFHRELLVERQWQK